MTSQMFRFYILAHLALHVSALSFTAECECECAKNCEAVQVQTDAGWLCGRVRDAENGTKYASFRGIPYGQSPEGERRFTELEPVEPWEGFLDASEDSPACPQKDMLYGSIPLQKKGMSEDCIYANVHVPCKHLPQEGTCTEAGTGIPILVMIHGGGFNVGSGLSDLHGPEYLMTKDVIVITFNYRINVFGFLSIANCSKVPGNQALRDQVTLLRWVQRNIRAFGGNPDDVTLMGQSAGAACAHLLTLSNETNGLFKGVIESSGTGIPNFFTTSPRFAEEISGPFLSFLGINSTTTECSVIHQQLTQKSLVDIMHANTIIQNQYGIISFSPVAEQKYEGVTRILDDTPLNLMAAGRGKDYPFLISYTDQEFESFRWASMTINLLQRVKDNPTLLLPHRLTYLPEDQLSNITQRVYEKCFNGTETLDKLVHYMSYFFFKYPALKLAEWRAKHAPVYMMKYSYKSEKSLIKEALWLEYEGAGHLEDMTFIFRVNSKLKHDYVSFPPTNNDDRMKDTMVTMITNFMRCSNTTCAEGDDWTPYTSTKPQYQNMAEPYVYSMTELSDEEVDMVQFMDSIDSEVGNFEYQLISN